jgi:predicted transglutaminase-like cysteine proteinase
MNWFLRLNSARIRAFALAAGLASMLAGAAFAAAPGQGHGLFGSEEIRNGDLTAFSKWNDMISHHDWEEQRKGAKLPCRVTSAFKCRRDEWQDLLTRIEGKDWKARIAAINSFMNEAEYITDIRNWGMADYWASVREFLRKDGDCEDYAIAKYYSLKALGFNVSDMRVVVLEDTNLKTAHAVLAVSLNGETLILDNQMPDVVKATSILHYRPIYSINEQAWWLHKL